jgi:hypothetical protein
VAVIAVLEHALMVLIEPLGPMLLLLLISLLLSEMYPSIGSLAVAGAFVIGVTQRPLWLAFTLTLGAVALNLALLLARWRLSAGLLETGFAVASHLLAVLGILCGGGWTLGRCISWLVRSAVSRVSWLVGRAIPVQS